MSLDIPSNPTNIHTPPYLSLNRRTSNLVVTMLESPVQTLEASAKWESSRERYQYGLGCIYMEAINEFLHEATSLYIKVAFFFVTASLSGDKYPVIFYISWISIIEQSSSARFKYFVLTSKLNSSFPVTSFLLGGCSFFLRHSLFLLWSSLFS